MKTQLTQCRRDARDRARNVSGDGCSLSGGGGRCSLCLLLHLRVALFEIEHFDLSCRIDLVNSISR